MEGCIQLLDQPFKMGLTVEHCGGVLLCGLHSTGEPALWPGPTHVPH